MKTFILFIGLFIAGTSTAQSLNDTIFFNSGEIRNVHVVKETKNALVYQYDRGNGKPLSARVRKSMIHGYTIIDEGQNVLTSHKNAVRKEQQKADGRGFGIFLGGLAVGGILLGGLTVLVLNTMTGLVF